MLGKTDVVVIGGGVVGTSIARELSKYQLDITLVEKAPDVCTGTSKANTALVHAGFNADFDTLKGRLNVRGNELFRNKISEELDVPLEWIGALVIAKNDDEVKTLERLLENGNKNGVPDLEIIKGDKVFELEPSLSEDVIAALHAPTAGIVNPFELTVAQAENAAKNGAEIILEAEVLDIEVNDDHKIVKTAKGDIETELVINAAGLFSDEIARMVGIDDFKITPRKGEYYLYDKKLDIDVSHTIFQTPTKVTKGVVVTPTDEDNLLIGPTAEEQEDKSDVSTSQEGLDSVINGAQKTIPDLSTRGVIREFSGLRAAINETGDFLIEASDKVDGFINVAGIQSPGLASSPAIAEKVGEIVGELKELKPDPDFDPYQEAPPRFRHMNHEERAELIEEDPRYSEIICRCETVTKGEILDAMEGVVGARTVNGVKRRVRPGGGRCQGGFCEPLVVNLISEKWGIPKDEVVLESSESELLIEPAKVSLQKGVNRDE